MVWPVIGLLAAVFALGALAGWLGERVAGAGGATAGGVVAVTVGVVAGSALRRRLSRSRR